MNDDVAHPDPLADLLAKELSQWVEAVNELNRTIARQTAERDKLQAKIVAAETLLGRHAVLKPGSEIPRTVREMVLDVMNDRVPRTPQEMREDLIARGADAARVSTSTGNFYTTLRRLLDEGALRKQSDGRYCLG